MDLYEVFEKYNDDYLKFQDVEDPRHIRADMCAFLLLDELVPPKKSSYMVAGAEHDEIYLQVDCSLLADKATEEDIRNLVRCGVRYCSDVESLAMFV